MRDFYDLLEKTLTDKGKSIFLGATTTSYHATLHNDTQQTDTKHR
jgi:hypothetical protein